MTTEAFISNELYEFASQKFSALTSPQVWYTFPEVTGASGLGESTPLEDATHFQSTSREYIGGLADGDEFTLEVSEIQVSPDILVVAKNFKGLTKYMRVTAKNISVSPNTTRVWTFDAVFMGWSRAPTVASIPKLNFTFKISGGVTET